MRCRFKTSTHNTRSENLGGEDELAVYKIGGG